MSRAKLWLILIFYVPQYVVLHSLLQPLKFLVLLNTADILTGNVLNIFVVIFQLVSNANIFVAVPSAAMIKIAS